MFPFARLAGAVTLSAAVAVSLCAAAVGTLPRTAAAATPDTGRQFNVLGAAGTPVGDVIAAVRLAGGTVTDSNAVIGLVTATAGSDGFTRQLLHQAGIA